jgi:hypothetical protein
MYQKNKLQCQRVLYDPLTMGQDAIEGDTLTLCLTLLSARLFSLLWRSDREM